MLVTTRRIDEDCAALSSLLWSNVQNCRDRALHASSQAASESNPLPSCFTILYVQLAQTLSSGRRSTVEKVPRKAFNSKGILWPLQPRDLTPPMGPAQSAEAHVARCYRLLAISAEPLFYLACALCVTREAGFPHLLVTPVRERLLWCLVNLFDPNGAGVAAFPWPQRADIQPLELSAFQMTWAESLKSQDTMTLTAFLGALLDGGGRTLTDVWRLTKGCEEALVLSLQAGRRRFVYVPDNWHAGYLSVLDTFEYKLASLDDQLYAVAKSGDSGDFEQWLYYMYESFEACYRLHQCHGPNCSEVPVAKAFARCKGCLFTHYYSRECQRTDWRTAETPHKLSCPSLSVLT